MEGGSYGKFKFYRYFRWGIGKVVRVEVTCRTCPYSFDTPLNSLYNCLNRFDPRESLSLRPS